VRDDISVRGPTEWSKDTDIQAPTLFFSLLHSGFFVPEDEIKGRKIADRLATRVIDAYLASSQDLQNGGQVRTRGVENLMACASPEANEEFLDALRTVVGNQYHKLNSKASVDAINKLKGPEQMRAIQKQAEEIANLLRSVPSHRDSSKKVIDQHMGYEG
jgi:hypothetical protein